MILLSMAKKKAKVKTQKTKEKKETKSEFKVKVEEAEEAQEVEKEVKISPAGGENPAYVDTPISQNEDVKAYDHPHSEHHEEVKEPEPEPEHEPDSKSAKSADKNPLSFWAIFFAFTISLILGGLLVGGIFYFRTNVDITTPKETPTPKSTITPDTNQPEPTEESGSVEISELKVQILNGSGIAGEANSVAALLVTAGFEDIDTANAKTYDYTKTEISTKKSLRSSVVDEIESALSGYSLATGSDLDEDYEYDVVVIVGTSKN